MTTTAGPAPTTERWRRWLRLAPLVALLLAIAAATLLALGPLGWRVGWWHFRFAFFSLMPWAAYCGLAAMALAVLALLFGRRSIAGRQIAIGVIAFLIGAAIAYVPWQYSEMRGMVPNDITTDLQNPPPYVAVLALRKAATSPNTGEYKGAKIAEQQQRSYPDIAPVMLASASDEAFARALEAARRMGWTIVETDPGAGRIEASDRTRWFGFIDDIVVRIAAADGGSRVDVRSSSRVGTGDFGTNAARVRRYLAALRQGS
jgi:uncharacterized protein (DUF1499 family)